jgi:hypothetical protein
MTRRCDYPCRACRKECPAEFLAAFPIDIRFSGTGSVWLGPSAAQTQATGCGHTLPMQIGRVSLDCQPMAEMAARYFWRRFRYVAVFWAALWPLVDTDQQDDCKKKGKK